MTGGHRHLPLGPPGLLLTSYGGVLADRYQRTTVMIVSAVASAVIMAGIAIAVAADAPVWIVRRVRASRCRGGA